MERSLRAGQPAPHFHYLERVVVTSGSILRETEGPMCPPVPTNKGCLLPRRGMGK